jgi:hypothetical protein
MSRHIEGEQKGLGGKHAVLGANAARRLNPSTSPQEGLTFIEQFVLPTPDLCKKLRGEKKILAGGPVAGAIALALIIKAESMLELDELIESLPHLATNGNNRNSSHQL